LRIDPNHKGAHEYIGQAYLKAGQPDKAAEHLARLEQICGKALRGISGLYLESNGCLQERKVATRHAEPINKNARNQCGRFCSSPENYFKWAEMSLVISNIETVFLPPKYGFQLVIRIDVAAVDAILQLMLFDVVPDFLGDIRTRKWICTDDRCQNS
jgi:hypothetical protein